MGQSDGQMKTDDGDIAEQEKSKRGLRVGAGNPGVSAVYLPAYLRSWDWLDGEGGGGGLSGADEGVEPRCVSKSNSLGGNTYSQVDSWLCANTRASEALNQTQHQQGFN